MRNIIIATAAAIVMAGTSLINTQPASADTYVRVVHNGGHHGRVCRTVVRNKVVWRHGHRHVVRVKVRRCSRR